MNKLKIDYLVHGIVVSDYLETGDTPEQVMEQLSYKVIGFSGGTETSITNADGAVLLIKNSSIDGIVIVPIVEQS